MSLVFDQSVTNKSKSFNSIEPSSLFSRLKTNVLTAEQSNNIICCRQCRAGAAGRLERCAHTSDSEQNTDDWRALRNPIWRRKNADRASAPLLVIVAPSETGSLALSLLPSAPPPLPRHCTGETGSPRAADVSSLPPRRYSGLSRAAVRRYMMNNMDAVGR